MAYQYQEFPRWLYRFGEQPKSVGTEAERDAALAEGWSLTVVTEPPAITDPVDDNPAPKRGRKKVEA